MDAKRKICLHRQCRFRWGYSRRQIECYRLFGSDQLVDNQTVQKGDTLFVFDTTALKASVAQAQSALEQAKSRLSVTDLEALASKRNAQSSQQSILSLRDQVAAAKAKLDKAQADY